VSTAVAVVDRGQVAQDRAGAEEAEHHVMPIGRDDGDLDPPLADDQHCARVVALVEQDVAARIAPGRAGLLDRFTVGRLKQIEERGRAQGCGSSPSV